MLFQSKLAIIRDDYLNEKNKSCNNNEVTKDKPSSPTTKATIVPSLIEDRIAHVTQSLERLEVGLAESNVLLSLHDHFERLEADRSTLRLEMRRVEDENEWLREELNDTQRHRSLTSSNNSANSEKRLVGPTNSFSITNIFGPFHKSEEGHVYTSLQKKTLV